MPLQESVADNLLLMPKMRWKTKYLLQNTLASLPLNSDLYFRLQKQFGGFKHFSINSKVDQGISLLEALKANNLELRGKNTAEMGTGWTPIIPMLFALAGQSRCVTCDVSQLLQYDLCVQAAVQFNRIAADLAKKISWAWGEESEINLRVMQSSLDAHDLLTKLHIDYHSDSSHPLRFLEDAGTDIFFTNDTLEHIPCKQLPFIFTEIRRVLKPDGVMIHLVDCSDHYSFDDTNINRINFLRFSTDQWERYNTRFLFQNRLRPSEYQQLLTSSGFTIEYWSQKQDQRALQELKSFPLDPGFMRFSSEDLCASSFIVIARPHIQP